MKPITVVLLSSVLIVAATTVIILGLGKKTPEGFKTVPLVHGDLSLTVTASGTVNPRTLISVGTQVSGTVAELYADFNSPVKKGQLIALLDTTMLSAALVEAGAAYDKAGIQYRLAEKNLPRARALAEKNLGTQAELDAAEAEADLAKANLAAAGAQRERARINLRYAKILSPINGVVINRAVDVGQTVAASLSAPTIFSIANDLKNMQVEAGIDEADIGRLAIGQRASFTVDAWPDRSYTGVVSQIRLQPTTLQNVVSYTVIIDVRNEDQSLMPGMTANITVEIRSLHNVQTIPASALSFKPALPGKKEGEKPPSRDSARNPAGAAGEARGNRPGKVDSSETGHGRLYLLENGLPSRRSIRVLMHAGRTVAIESDIPDSASVITGLAGKPKSGAAEAGSSPLGPFGGMRGRH